MAIIMIPGDRKWEGMKGYGDEGKGKGKRKRKRKRTRKRDTLRDEEFRGPHGERVVKCPSASVPWC